MRSCARSKERERERIRERVHKNLALCRRRDSTLRNGYKCNESYKSMTKIGLIHYRVAERVRYVARLYRILSYATRLNAASRPLTIFSGS